ETIDPITCQTTIPSRMGAKLVFADERQAEVSVVTRGSEKTTRQVTVRVQRTPTDWEITEHSCIDLANPVTGEFTFIRTGRLAQASVPAPYNNTQWHILYSSDQRVSIVPLTFDAESQCETDGETTTCDPSQFSENALVEVKGDLTEAGAIVRQMSLQ
ncbi:MAG: hypothetical protein AAGA45_08105, partial [Verrucomicrobiota bacterium]